MLSVPYSVELNDLGIFQMKGLTGPDFLQMFKDHFDQLHADAGRQRAGDGPGAAPVRYRPAVPLQVPRPGPRYIAGHTDVWLTTSDDIAEHYARTTAGAAA